MNNSTLSFPDRDALIWGSILPSNEKLLLLAINDIGWRGPDWAFLRQKLAIMCSFTDAEFVLACASLIDQNILEIKISEDHRRFPWCVNFDKIPRQ